MKKHLLKIAIPFIVIILVITIYISLTSNNHPNPVNNSNAEIPSRIVSLAPNITEILFALGLGDKVAAVSNDSDYPPEAANRKKVGAFWQPSTESIIAAKPDLIIAEQFEQQIAVADTLKRLGYKVLIIKREKIDDLFPAIEQIGQIAGCSQKAKKLVSDIKQKINHNRQMFESAKKIKTLWVIQMEPLRVAGRDTFINELIEIAGGENAIGDTVFKYPQLSTEQLLGCGAEVIIQSVMVKENMENEQKIAEKFWQKMPNLPAVKNHRIYMCDSDATLRLGPRIPQAIDEIADFLRPQTVNKDGIGEPNSK